MDQQNENELNDFFLGKLHLEKDGIYGLDLVELMKLIEPLPSTLVDRQLNRVLVEQGGLIGVHPSNSQQSVYGLLKAIGVENISKLNISQREEDDTNGVVKFKFVLDIAMVNGIVRVFGEWCTWKKDRVDDVLMYLLAPIYNLGLDEITSLKSDCLFKESLLGTKSKLVEEFYECYLSVSDDEMAKMKKGFERFVDSNN